MIETKNNIKLKNKIRSDIIFSDKKKDFCYVICIIPDVGIGFLARLNVFSGSTPTNECRYILG